jgi:hypothetical protein
LEKANCELLQKLSFTRKLLPQDLIGDEPIVRE